MSSYTGSQRRKAFPQRGFEATASPPPMMPNNVYMCNGVPCTYTFHGTTFFPTPQLQAAPMPGAPDVTMYPGTPYGPAQGPSQTYAPAMMYPCANPQMYLPPYQQFTPMQMANQAHPLMYSNSTLQTLNNGADTPSPISISPHGTPPFFVQGDMRPEMFYMPPSPGQAYPPFSTPLMLATAPDPSVQFCEVAAPEQQQGTNVPTEVIPQPVAVDVVPTDTTDASKSDAAYKEQASTETPIVSVKDLQIVETENEKSSETRYRSSRPGGRYSDSQTNEFNGRGEWRRNRGRGAMNNNPKYPCNNNNSSLANNNYKDGGNFGRGGYRTGNGGRGQNSGAGGRRNANRASTPPDAFYLQTNNLINQFQVSSYAGGRNVQQLPYHAANHTAVVAAAASGGSQQVQAALNYNVAHPPPPLPHNQNNVPPRRFNSIHSNQRRNYHPSNYASRKRIEVDNGAAGDAPLHNQEALPSSSKGSPPPSVASTEQDALCSGVKSLNVQ